MFQQGVISLRPVWCLILIRFKHLHNTVYLSYVIVSFNTNAVDNLSNITLPIWRNFYDGCSYWHNPTYLWGTVMHRFNCTSVAVPSGQLSMCLPINPSACNLSHPHIGWTCKLHKEKMPHESNPRSCFCEVMVQPTQHFFLFKITGIITMNEPISFWFMFFTTILNNKFCNSAFLLLNTNHQTLPIVCTRQVLVVYWNAMFLLYWNIKLNTFLKSGISIAKRFCMCACERQCVSYKS